MAYITLADFIARVDREDVRRLLSDNSQAAELLDLATDPPQTLQVIFDDAAGAVEGALLRGERYSVADLQSLTGPSLSLLKRVNCDVALSYLLQRRPDRDPERVKAQCEIAEAHLSNLAGGKNVFNIPTVLDAGLQHLVGPTAVDLQNLNMNVDHCRPHYYPRRRLPGLITRD